MVDINSQSLRGIAGSMISKARKQTLEAPKGVVGKAYEAVTGQIKEYNEAVEKLADAEAKAGEVDRKLAEVRRKLEAINTKVRQGLVVDEKTRKKLNKLTEEERKQALDKIRERLRQETEKLTATEADLGKKREKLTATISRTSSNVQELTRHNSIMGNGLVMLTSKVAGLATAFFSLRDALKTIEVRVKFAAASIAEQGVVIDGTLNNLVKLKDETLAWNDTVTQTVERLGKMGMSAQETYGLLGTLRKEIRLSVEEQGKLRDFTGEAAENIGHMAVLLQVNTEELATATTGASKRFGKSIRSMGDEMAGMYDEIQRIRTATDGAVVDFRDITRATLEAQASFQGYNLNLRTTAAVLGGMTAKMQEQGATYEMAQKGAEQLFGVLAGGKAPDWAKYMAGKDLQSEVRSALKGVELAFDKTGKILPKKLELVKSALGEAFGPETLKELTDAQVVNLQDFAVNWKKYGKLSSANMTEEMFRGSKSGMKAMLTIMEKTSKGPEMREVLKRVWGLDDQAATAATVALRRGGFDKMMQEIGTLKAETEGRKPPTIKDLKDQTADMVHNLGIANKGLEGLKNSLLSRFEDPIFATVMGITGAGLSGLMQALQMGAGVAVAGAFSKSGMAGALAGSTKSLGSMAKFLGKTGGKAVLLTAAFAAGFAVMTWFRKKFPDVFNAFDRGIQGVVDGVMKSFDFLTGGVFDLNLAINEEEAAHRGLTSVLDANSEAGKSANRNMLALAKTVEKGAKGAGAETSAQAIRFIKGFKGVQLEELAERIAKSTKMDEAKVMTRLKGLQAMKVTLPQKYLDKLALAETVEKGATEVGAETSAQAIQFLKGYKPEDLEELAKQLAKKSKLGKEEIMQRMMDLRAMKAAAKEAQQGGRRPRGAREPGVRKPGAKTAREPGVRPSGAREPGAKAARKPGVPLARMPAAEPMAAMALAEPALLERVARATPGPPDPAPKAATAGRPTGGQGIRQGRASVDPDGTINLKVMIPRDALDRSNNLASAYTE